MLTLAKRFGRWLWGWRRGLAFLILALAVAIPQYEYVRSAEQRRADSCHSRQNLYDGEIALATFIGEKFGATPQQIADGIAELKSKKLGERPRC